MFDVRWWKKACKKTCQPQESHTKVPARGNSLIGLKLLHSMLEVYKHAWLIQCIQASALHARSIMTITHKKLSERKSTCSVHGHSGSELRSTTPLCATDHGMWSASFTLPVHCILVPFPMWHPPRAVFLEKGELSVHLLRLRGGLQTSLPGGANSRTG